MHAPCAMRGPRTRTCPMKPSPIWRVWRWKDGFADGFCCRRSNFEDASLCVLKSKSKFYVLELGCRNEFVWIQKMRLVSRNLVVERDTTEQIL
jgi:hypothetical protein